MKIKLEVDCEFVDQLVVASLKDSLKLTEENVSNHPEDIKYDKKLVKALKRVINYHLPYSERIE